LLNRGLRTRQTDSFDRDRKAISTNFRRFADRDRYRDRDLIRFTLPILLMLYHETVTLVVVTVIVER